MDGVIAGWALLLLAAAAVGYGLYLIIKAAVRDGVREALRQTEAEKAAQRDNENVKTRT